MKNTQKHFSIVAMAALLGAAACAAPDYPDAVPATTASTAGVNYLIVNASPSPTPLTIAFDNTAFTPLPYLGIASPVGATSSNYTLLSAGPRNILYSSILRADASGSLTDLVQRSTVPVRGVNQTIFITDTLTRPFIPAVAANPTATPPVTASAAVTGGLRTLIVPDTLTAPAAGNAHIRFFHLAPNAPAVWVNVQGSAAPLFSNRGYRQAGTGNAFARFTPVLAGTYTLEVRTRSATGPVALTVPGVILAQGKIYTIYARGLVGNATTPLGASIITHN